MLDGLWKNLEHIAGSIQWEFKDNLKNKNEVNNIYKTKTNNLTEKYKFRTELLRTFQLNRLNELRRWLVMEKLPEDHFIDKSEIEYIDAEP